MKIRDSALFIFLSLCFGLVLFLPTFAQPLENEAWAPDIQSLNGVEVVLVPAGCFMMGNDQIREERPVHPVCIQKSFWLYRYEVTNGQFGSEGLFKDPNQPRELVDWKTAHDYCTGQGGRLPTEAEWEYAARGPSSWFYPWGNDYNQEAYVWGTNTTRPIKGRESGASWVGAEDMAGNVLEWTSSLAYDYIYNATDGREDVTAAGNRIVRGAVSYEMSALPLMTTRLAIDPQRIRNDLGFRCAIDYTSERIGTQVFLDPLLTPSPTFMTMPTAAPALSSTPLPTLPLKPTPTPMS